MNNILKIAIIFSIIMVFTLLSGCVSDTTSSDVTIEHRVADTEKGSEVEQPGELSEGVNSVKSTPWEESGDDSATFLTYYTEGIDLSRRGLYADAVAAFTSSISANASFTEAYFQRGLANYHLGYVYTYEGKEPKYFELARQDFATVIQRDPSNNEALAMKGWANYWIGFYYSDRIYVKNSTISSYFEEGIDDCTRALAIDSRNTNALNCRAANYLYRVQGHHVVVADPTYIERAKSDIDASLRINSTNPWAYYLLGRYYTTRGGETLALDAFEEAIRLEPDEAWFYLYGGITADHTDNKQKSFDYTKKAIELQPRFAAAYNNLALMSSDKQPDYEARLTGYEKAIEIDPRAACYRNYAISLWNFKNWDKQTQEQVLNLLDKALELDPSDYEVHGDKALILIYMNRYEESAREISKFKQHARTNEDIEWAARIELYNGMKPWYFT